jgi:1,4-dihydroxy-2-naphthoyl-CoA synthase
MLTQQYSGQQALEMGLANSVVPHERLRDETIRYCNLIKNNSPVILQLQKITFNESAEYLEAEPSPTERYASDYPESEESEERRLAFIERRPIDPDKNLPITLTERQASLLE